MSPVGAIRESPLPLGEETHKTGSFPVSGQYVILNEVKNLRWFPCGDFQGGNVLNACDFRSFAALRMTYSRVVLIWNGPYLPLSAPMG